MTEPYMNSIHFQAKANMIVIQILGVERYSEKTEIEKVKANFI